MVDSSMLTGSVFPLRRGERYERDDPVHPLVVEPLDDSWRVWFGFVMSANTMPCRILDGLVDLPFYRHRYEVSRQLSPFNDMLYARRNVPGGLVSFLGRTRFVKTAAGVQGTELDADQLAAALIEDLRLSPAIVAAQRDAGLL